MTRSKHSGDSPSKSTRTEYQYNNHQHRIENKSRNIRKPKHSNAQIINYPITRSMYNVNEANEMPSRYDARYRTINKREWHARNTPQTHGPIHPTIRKTYERCPTVGRTFKKHTQRQCRSAIANDEYTAGILDFRHLNKHSDRSVKKRSHPMSTRSSPNESSLCLSTATDSPDATDMACAPPGSFYNSEDNSADSYDEMPSCSHTMPNGHEYNSQHRKPFEDARNHNNYVIAKSPTHYLRRPRTFYVQRDRHTDRTFRPDINNNVPYFNSGEKQADPEIRGTKLDDVIYEETPQRFRNCKPKNTNVIQKQTRITFVQSSPFNVHPKTNVPIMATQMPEDKVDVSRPNSSNSDSNINVTMEKAGPDLNNIIRTLKSMDPNLLSIVWENLGMAAKRKQTKKADSSPFEATRYKTANPIAADASQKNRDTLKRETINGVHTKYNIIGNKINGEESEHKINGVDLQTKQNKRESQQETSKKRKRNVTEENNEVRTRFETTSEDFSSQQQQKLKCQRVATKTNVKEHANKFDKSSANKSNTERINENIKRKDNCANNSAKVDNDIKLDATHDDFEKQATSLHWKTMDDEEQNKVLVKVKKMLMSADIKCKENGISLLKTIVSRESDTIATILNENVLSFLTMETILASKTCTRLACHTMGIILNHSTFYINNYVQDFLGILVRTLGVSLDDKKYNDRVSCLFEILAKIVMRVEQQHLFPINTLLDRTKLFVYIFKLQELIAFTQINMHCYLMDVVKAFVNESQSIDRNLLGMISNMKGISHVFVAQIFVREGTDVDGIEEYGGRDGQKTAAEQKIHPIANKLVTKTKEPAITKQEMKNYMLSNSALFLACGKLVERMEHIASAKKESDERTQKAVEESEAKVRKEKDRLLFLNEEACHKQDATGERINKKIDQKNENEGTAKIIHERKNQKLFQLILENYKDNILGAQCMNDHEFQYHVNVFATVNIILKYSTLCEENIKTLLRLANNVTKSYLANRTTNIDDLARDEHLVSEKTNNDNVINTIGTLWKILANKLLPFVEVAEIMNANINKVLNTPLSHWMKVLKGQYDVGIKSTILIVLYISHCYKIQFNHFGANVLTNILSTLTQHKQLPNYMLKILIFLACVNKMKDLVKQLNSHIDKCDDLELIHTNHVSLLSNWNNYRSNEKFKAFLIKKHLNGKYFIRFALNNDNVLFTLIQMIEMQPMREPMLAQFRKIIELKLNTHSDKYLIDNLWNGLTNVLRNYDKLFYENIKCYVMLCQKKVPSVFEIQTEHNATDKAISGNENVTNDTHRNNSTAVATATNVNKLIHIFELLTKYIAKIQVNAQNIELLMVLQCLLFSILHVTRPLRDRRFIQVTTHSNCVEPLIQTGALAKTTNNPASAKYAYVHLYLINDILDMSREHKMQLTLNFDYNVLFKHLINGNLIYIEELLKLFKKLFVHRSNESLLKIIEKFKLNFIDNGALYDGFFMFLLNLVFVNNNPNDVFKVLILMLKFNGEFLCTNAYNHTLISYIIDTKEYTRDFVRYLNQLLSLYMTYAVDYRKCVGKLRRQLVVELIQGHRNELVERFGEMTAMKQLEDKLNRLSIG